MIDLFKKSLLAALGLAVVTREEIEQTVERLAAEGKIQADTGRQIVEDLFRDTQEQWRNAQAQMKDVVRSGLDNLDIGSRQEFRDLSARVGNLEERLAMAERVLAKLTDVTGAPVVPPAVEPPQS